MLEEKVKHWSENLARGMDRRQVLKGMGTSVFAALASLAAGHTFVSGASARTGDKPSLMDGGPNCAPPGPYCNNGNGPLSGCQGGHCHSHLYNGQLLSCRIMYGWYSTGCWTTPTAGGYWTCCDCGCGANGGSPLCGCAQYRHTTLPPPPLPDSPVAGGSDA